MNVTVGQEVAVATYGGHAPRFSFGWFVKKVSPTGQITVERDNLAGKVAKRFRPDGRELGGNSYYSSRMETNVAEIQARLAAIQAREEATAAFHKISALLEKKVGVPGRWMLDKTQLTEVLAEMDELVAAARAKVEALS
jgi:hypothetical protein